MAKMSQATRDAIVDQVVDHTFAAREKAKDEAGRALIQALYKEAYSKKERDLIASLSSAYVEEIHTVKINYEGETASNSVIYIETTEPIKLPRGHGSTIKYLFDGESKGRKRLLEWLDAVNKLAADKRALRKEARAIVNSCNTDKRLLEVWPDVATMVDPILLGMAPKEYLPAVDVSVINAKIQQELEKANAG